MMPEMGEKLINYMAPGIGSNHVDDMRSYHSNHLLFEYIRCALKLLLFIDINFTFLSKQDKAKRERLIKKEVINIMKWTKIKKNI